MMEYVIRFFAGGLAVSTFAIFSDVLRPKSVACSRSVVFQRWGLPIDEEAQGIGPARSGIYGLRLACVRVRPSMAVARGGLNDRQGEAFGVDGYQVA